MIAEIRYLRYEPVNHPIVMEAPEQAPDPALGESIERVVLRSNYDQSTAMYARATGHAFREVVERYVAPPQTTKEMAERCGGFDAVINKGGVDVCVVDERAT